MRPRGMIFDTQRFSLHDGPGLRTCLFFKGCGLHCDWCSNPESQRTAPELAVFADQCFACGDCLPVCEPAALSLDDGKLLWREPACDRCAKCVPACAANAIQIIGEQVDDREAFARVLRDTSFFRQGGGLTLTGGEPLLQPEFAQAVLALAGAEGLHTSLETCGQVPWSSFQRVLPYLDLVLFDLKHMDPVRHKRATGVDNTLIKENARRLAAAGARTIIRVPLIPGFNATLEDIAAVGDFVIKLETVHEVHLLPYHALGRAKYRALGRDYPMGSTPPLKPADAEPFARVLHERGLKVAVGG